MIEIRKADKRKMFSGIFVSAVLLIVFGNAPSIYGDQQSYTLVCRGGGTMEGSYLNTPSRHSFSVTFNKSAYSSSKRQPQQGECAWIDRPLRENEPSSLFIPSLSREIRISLKFSSAGARVDEGIGSGITGPPQQRLILESLLYAITKGNIFYVRVHRVDTRERTSYFHVDQLGP